jgi:hypothetical protein
MKLKTLALTALVGLALSPSLVSPVFAQDEPVPSECALLGPGESSLPTAPTRTPTADVSRTPPKVCGYDIQGLPPELLVDFPLPDTCASLARRANTLHHLTHDWSPVERQALTALIKAKQDYLEAHNGEIVTDGVPFVIAVVYESEATQDAFSALLVRISKGTLPFHSNVETRQLDTRLNRVYQVVQAGDETLWEGGYPVTKSRVREAEKSWLAYRDAWVHVTQLRYPTIPSSSLLYALTAQRLEQLSELAELRKSVH